jgi:hypothetical protein
VEVEVVENDTDGHPSWDPHLLVNMSWAPKCCDGLNNWVTKRKTGGAVVDDAFGNEMGHSHWQKPIKGRDRHLPFRKFRGVMVVDDAYSYLVVVAESAQINDFSHVAEASFQRLFSKYHPIRPFCCPCSCVFFCWTVRHPNY